jgi:hypothetical protein
MLFVLTIILILVLILIVMSLLYSINPTKATDKNSFDLKLQQNSIAKRDCNNEIIYALDDVVCDNVCSSNGSFIAQNGFCVNELAAIEIPSINQCDAKLGVLAYYVGDETLGTANFLCLSIDPGIQPNDISQPNLMCKNGTLSGGINYLKHFPEMSDCYCMNNDKFLAVIIRGTSIIRDYVVCTNKNNMKAYTDGVGLTYTK